MRVARQRLDTRRVVEEAARIADEDGLAHVTLARVASALDVRAPSLYNHVDGRDGLLRDLSIASVGELAETLREAAIGRSGPEALTAVAHAYRAYAHEHPGRYAATVRAPAPGDEEHAAAAERAVSVIVAVLGAWRFEEDEALHRVRVIRSALHGFVSIEADGGFGLPLDVGRSFEHLLETLLAGLGDGGER